MLMEKSVRPKSYIWTNNSTQQGIWMWHSSIIWGAPFQKGELTIPISKQTKCTALNVANQQILSSFLMFKIICNVV